MKLINLKKSIHSDLTLINLDNNETIEHIQCYSETFDFYKKYEVIGIRARKRDVIEVAIREAKVCTTDSKTED